MAEARQNWIQRFVLGALCLSAWGAVFAQHDPAVPPQSHTVHIQSPQSGSLAGRLTDLHSVPLAGVTVVLHNQATGAEARTTTAKNGAFRFSSLDAGQYTLEADAVQLGHGSLEGILVTGGSEARVQAAMQFAPTAPALLATAVPSTATDLPPRAHSAPLSAPNQPALAAGLLQIPPRPVPLTPRPGLSTSSPALVASIDSELLRLMPVAASRHADGSRESAQSATQAQTPPQFVAQPSASAQTLRATRVPASQLTDGGTSAPQRAQPDTQARVSQRRIPLETQSVSMQLALFAAPPRTLPLKACVAPDLAALAVPARAVQANLVKPPALAPSEGAGQPPDPVTLVVTTTVTAAQLQALPASGRRWQEFLLDAPAASASADSSQASFRGSQESAEITIDGVNTRLAFGVAAGSGSRVSDPEDNEEDQQSGMRRTWSGGRGLGVSEAAIREVTTAAGNVEAEGMRSSGGRTAIRTESGENAFHGQGFLFDRQNTWGARNPFTQWLQNTGMAATPGSTPIIPSEPVFSPIPFTPPDHETVWGLGMGSHIRRDKLFWFAALDSYRRNDPGLAVAKHPIETYIDPATGNQYCVGFFCPPSDAQVQLLSAQLDESPNQAARDYFGMPGSAYHPAGLEQLVSLLGPSPRTAAQWLGFGRIDWHAAERHRFTLEGVGADWNSPGGGLTRVSENYGSHSFGSSEAGQEWLLARWEAYLTPNLLAISQASVGHTILSVRPDTPSAFESGFLQDGNVNSYGQLPQIVVDSRYGFTIGNPSRFGQGSYPDEHLYHAQEMLDWVHDRLLVRAGFELDHNADAVSFLRNQTGTYVYSKVQDFISDALVLEKFGPNPDGWNLSTQHFDEHNCDPANDGQLTGALPCYSYYTQTMGPTNWHLGTNDWAGYTTVQWQPNKIAVLSAGLRWEREQMPPPIASLDNPQLPFTEKLPNLGNNLGPRVSLAIGEAHSRWPVLRLGYGMYYGRVPNASIETALTQTGSPKGDLYFFFRPNDGYTSIDNIGSAPFFPNVLASDPTSVVKPGVVGFAPNFRNPEVHQAVAAIEQPLPGRVQVTAAAMLSLGRRLPIAIDSNVDTANAGTITYSVKDPTGLGPITTTQIQVPFYPSVLGDCTPGSSTSSSLCGRLDANYQQITQIMSRANSTYEAAMIKLARYGARGLSLHLHYTYAHAMDWNPNESTLVAGSDVLDPNPTQFHQEYGTSNLDVRHSAAAMVVYEAPWKLRNLAGRLGNGWILSGIGQFRSGLPYTMRTTGSIPMLYGTNETIVGLGPGMNGSGGDNRVYGVGRNTYRYPDAWKADLRLGKRFNFGEMRQLEILAESFNLLNHQNVTQLETNGYTIENSGSSGTFPTLCYLTINTAGSASFGATTTIGSRTPIPAFGQPLNINATDFYRERQIELGLRMRF
jgi:hypothetical protein